MPFLCRQNTHDLLVGTISIGIPSAVVKHFFQFVIINYPNQPTRCENEDELTTLKKELYLHCTYKMPLGLQDSRYAKGKKKGKHCILCLCQLTGSHRKSLTIGIQNPNSTVKDFNPVPGINPESTAWNPESKTVLDSLTRGGSCFVGALVVGEGKG